MAKPVNIEPMPDTHRNSVASRPVPASRRKKIASGMRTTITGSFRRYPGMKRTRSVRKNTKKVSMRDKFLRHILIIVPLKVPLPNSPVRT
mgnify:CR=1 FL=1